jgi:hypothetical protein
MFSQIDVVDAFAHGARMELVINSFVINPQQPL